MPDLVTEQLHYDQLDVEGHAVRIRLNSTAVHVDHDGSPDSAQQVRVAYSRNGTLEQVTAGTVIFACWHASIPYIAADLPSEQREALGQSFKLTKIYGNVVLRNWRHVLARPDVASAPFSRYAFANSGRAPGA